jgi:hypothetical protein
LIDGIDELREIEVARLDALQAAIWSRALTGDIRAINTVGRIIDRRCRILGLYPPKGKAEKLFDTLVLPPTGNLGEATGDVGGDAVHGSASSAA